MSYITPDSTVQFYGDLGISDNYENSVFFKTTSTKDSAFSSINPIATGTALSYNRNTRGSFRIELPMSTLVRAGYLRFKNTSFENKWFYAFVKNVEYVNNETTEVFFELDYLMTWMGDFQLGQCFIEREHSRTDVIGDNLIEEGLEIGEYIVNDIESFEVITPTTADVVDEDGTIIATGGAIDYDICVVTSVQEEPDSTDASPKFKPVEGGNYGRIYSGLHNEYYTASNPTRLNKYLARLTKANKADSIVSIKMTPPNIKSELNTPLSSIGRTVSNVDNNTTLEGYTPTNHKLLTFPFNFLQISDGAGKTVDLYYEFFGGSGNCLFNFQGVSGAISEVICVPLLYKNRPINYEYQLTIDDFPDCAYTIDSYQAWLAQHKNESFYMSGVGAGGTAITLAKGGLAGTIGGARLGVGNYVPNNPSLMGATGGNPTAYNLMGGQYSSLAGAGAIAGGLVGLAGAYYNVNKAMAQNRDRMTKSPETHGNQTTNIAYAFGRKDFYHARKSITAQYAKRIDDYFNMFGYKQNYVDVPLKFNSASATALNGRPNYAYTKTVGCVVHGSLPADHASKIEQIFDNGIRFWRSISIIGNYNVDNNV